MVKYSRRKLPNTNKTLDKSKNTKLLVNKTSVISIGSNKYLKPKLKFLKTSGLLLRTIYKHLFILPNYN